MKERMDTGCRGRLSGLYRSEASLRDRWGGMYGAGFPVMRWQVYESGTHSSPEEVTVAS